MKKIIFPIALTLFLNYGLANANHHPHKNPKKYHHKHNIKAHKHKLIDTTYQN